jgi:hypothetical protein
MRASAAETKIRAQSNRRSLINALRESPILRDGPRTPQDGRLPLPRRWRDEKSVVVPSGNPVHEEESALGRDVAAMGLAERGLRRDDHVPQTIRSDVGERPLGHGKGEDVRRADDPAVRAVQRGNAGVIHQHHATVRRRAPQSAQRRVPHLS